MRRKRNYVNAAVITLALTFCGVVLACVGYIVHAHSQPAMQYPQLEPETYVQNGTLNDPAGRQTAPNALATEGMLTFSINATSGMGNGGGMANLLIENPSESGNRFTITILREDTGETLFQSDYLDPEQYVRGAPLDVGLMAGVHICVTNSDACCISDNVCIGRGAARITLYARN